MILNLNPIIFNKITTEKFKNSIKLIKININYPKYHIKKKKSESTTFITQRIMHQT